ncbi:MAG TPA: adenylate/guanylate cyclase domain-containing protein, partial [Candidatus Cloacimonadota bacterium]|nr:adenylate/guanylate cyclase domain-containing protein [Candidatus Cloacimonadota bacterium]
AIGDTINLGARLEGINKEYDTAKHIIISEFTYAQVKDYVQVRYLDEVKVKGKNLAVKIYELQGLK